MAIWLTIRDIEDWHQVAKQHYLKKAMKFDQETDGDIEDSVESPGDAELVLYFLYSRGMGRQKNIAEAIRHLQLAVEHAHEFAKFEMAVLLRYGIWFDQDIARARRLMIAASVPDLPEAAETLSFAAFEQIVANVFGLRPEGMEPFLFDDAGAARDQLRLLADDGDAAAQFYLGILQYYGVGVADDRNLGRRYLGEAASAGYLRAHSVLQKLDDSQ